MVEVIIPANMPKGGILGQFDSLITGNIVRKREQDLAVKREARSGLAENQRRTLNRGNDGRRGQIIDVSA